jgi:uncharacterized protein (UPF0335 family)
MTENQVLRIGVSIGAIALAGIHIWKPDLSIDSITVMLSVIAVLPWVQPLIKSIELLGVKLELRELQEQIADVKGAAESASRQAAFAVAATGSSVSVEKTAATSMKTADDALLALADEYDRIRETQPSGDARTVAMTDVIRKMIELVPLVSTFDVIQALHEKHQGRRLAAYAYLYAQPNPDFLQSLVDSVTKQEDKPFGQYWGLQAIARVLAKQGQAVIPTGVANQLRQFVERIPRGTDRDYELKKILRDLRQTEDRE